MAARTTRHRNEDEVMMMPPAPPMEPMGGYRYPERKTAAEKMFPFLVVVVIGMSFALGAMWNKINYLEKGVVAGAATGTTATANTGAQVQPTPVPVSLATIKGLFSQNLIKFGDANRKLLFVEVADPSCPYCHVAAGEDNSLNNQMGGQFKLVADGGTYDPPVMEMRKLVDSGKASFVYIYTPGHGNGEMATKALYCAFDQGKFWPAHDLLMTQAGYDLQNNQVKNDKTKSQQVVDYLATVVNANQLKDCIDSGKYDSRLTSDTALAASLGVQGTPGFFINTTNFAGAYSWTDMKKVADAAL